jgi:hypothetical protein
MQTLFSQNASREGKAGVESNFERVILPLRDLECIVSLVMKSVRMRATENDIASVLEPYADHRLASVKERRGFVGHCSFQFSASDLQSTRPGITGSFTWDEVALNKEYNSGGTRTIILDLRVSFPTKTYMVYVKNVESEQHSDCVPTLEISFLEDEER